ncbi:hypothetical protein ACOMHN_017859 [Nucella lapillus]
MESSENFFESEDEVKKLQELVKKLEKQNEVLRSKQKLSDVPEKSVLTQNNNHQRESASDSVKDRSSGGFDDVDVLDIDNLSLKDEEDSWLYSSPKPPTPQQTNTNLYKWVRQDFDHPSPEIESARRSLLSKLNEVARMNRSSSTPSLGTNTSPTKLVAPGSLSRSTEESPKPYGRPHQKQSLLSMTGNRIDNGTFTRTKKSHERPGPVAPERERGEDEAYHSFDGTTDVEKVARQQEESLRQSMATYTSPKRVIHNKAMSVASDTDNSGSPVGSNRSSPAQYDPENSYMNRHRNSFGSDNGTPPDSPRTIQQHSTPYPDPGPHRRSIPTNMSRLQYPQPASHSSDSSLEHQSTDSMDDLLAPETRTTSRLPGPGFRAASPAMAGLRPGLAGARGASPQRSGLPTPRRGIPRPSPGAGRSSLPTPRRSGIPSPRPSGPAGRDESWRDGCF